VLMTNHIHLLVTPTRAAAIPRLIIAVGRRYVQYVNHTYGRTGTLWDSRYKSSLVDAETYLLICQRYIELNPVRAGMVSDPTEYRWSSYRHHAFGAADPVLALHPLYIAFGPNEAERREIYRGLFTEALDEAPINNLRMALNQNQPIGNPRFCLTFRRQDRDRLAIFHDRSEQIAHLTVEKFSGVPVLARIRS